jgi:hypothetical protein
MSSSEIPETPKGLFGTKEASCVIDSKLAIAVNDLSTMISKKGGIERLYENYFTFGVPVSVVNSLDRVMKVAMCNDDSYEYPNPNYSALKCGLVGGFILGRRMVKRTSYSNMSSLQAGALDGLADLASNRGGDIQDSIYTTDKPALDVRRSLDQAGIADLAFSEETTVFTKELFLKSVTYLGASALSYVGLRVQLEI